MESKLIAVINYYLDNLDNDDDKREALEELADEPCEWVGHYLDDEIHDMNSKLGLAIWNWGFQNIDFEFIKDTYIIKLKQHDDDANARANDANETSEDE